MCRVVFCKIKKVLTKSIKTRRKKINWREGETGGRLQSPSRSCGKDYEADFIHKLFFALVIQRFNAQILNFVCV